jgi:hypothetical protein
MVTSREFSPIRMKALRRHAPAADRVADGHLTDVPDANRHAVLRGDHHVGDLIRRGRPADALHQARLAGAHDVAAARVLVVRLQRPDHVVECQPILRQIRRLGLDLELLGQPAPGVDLRHAGYPSQPRADHPVLERP